MTRRLSGADASFLATETAAIPMQGAGLSILASSAAAPALTVDRVRDIVGERLNRIEPFRQRLAGAPFGLDRPVWVDEGDVDLRAHIRAIGVPKSGTPRQLAEITAHSLARTLPRDRPLWEMLVLEGLEDGNTGIFAKVHHALLGGARATALYELLYDLDLDGKEHELSRAVHPESPPSPLAVAGSTIRSLACTPLGLARAAGTVGAAVAGVLRARHAVAWGDMARPFQAPASIFNGTITVPRACAYGSLSLGQIKLVKRAFGVTVNDVVLAICGGALRRYLATAGELPQQSLTCSVPVSIGGAARQRTQVMGNMVGTFGATLGTDVAEPVERLRRIAASTRAAKQLYAAMGPDLVPQLAGALPPIVLGALAHAYSKSGLARRTTPPYNVIVSNLPGPPMPLYSGGVPVLGNYVFGPLIEGCGLNITVMSYVDDLDVGIVAARDLMSDPWPVLAGMADSLAELVAAAPAAA